ncbi:MAG TPA: HDIG domain-containing protein [Candidatus Pacearchaeota archaeon]|nr:HDIG domain-containing protein [Candidatus Pacearchaeota archaeon]HOK94221.1 HDIG domain-containing protein [Candidatus Pacearchaeota archaeon]
MNRDEAINLVKENIKSPNLFKHCLAVEAIMQALAQNFGEDEEKWGLAGLLHDIDYEKTKDDPQKHSLIGVKMLEDLGIDKEICEAVKVHNDAHGILPETLMEKALFVTDPLSGLIVAATLVLPSKKIADLTPENVLHRFKEKAFARGANREVIKKCEEYLNLTLEDFIKIALEAMQGIASDLGL